MSQTVVRENENLSQLVVEALANAEGVPPAKLDPPLFEVIDPDALNRLFADTPSAARLNGRVAFDYNDYRVFVEEDGYVSVEPKET